MRTIDADALREDLRRFFPVEVLEGIEPKILFAQIMHDIDNAQTVPQTQITVFTESGNKEELEQELQKVLDGIRPKGEWKLDSVGVYCSECKLHPDYSTNFCPFCGADMRGEKV